MALDCRKVSWSLLSPWAPAGGVLRSSFSRGEEEACLLFHLSCPCRVTHTLRGPEGCCRASLEKIQAVKIMASSWTFVLLLIYLQYIIPVENWKIQINSASFYLCIKISLPRVNLHSYVSMYFIYKQPHVCCICIYTHI